MSPSSRAQLYARIAEEMKLIFAPRFLAISFLLLTSIPALRSLAIPGLYTSHDWESHITRIAAYYGALSDGQIPPRFAASFYNGLGSPIFVYIYPLPYFLGALLHAAGFSYVDSFKILMALGFIFSGLFAYFFFYEVFKSERAATLGALFYTWVPYRFLLIYVRGSLSEMLAYTFLPLVLFCLTKLARKVNWKWLACSAIAFSLLLLSQDLVALISLPILIAYSGILFIKEGSKKFLIFSAASFVWGFLIAAITYLPSLFERHFVHFDETTRNAYLGHFVTLKQLIKSPWGYGFDIKGAAGQMSLQIGLAHILVFISSIILLIYLIGKSLQSKKKNLFKENVILIFFFQCVFLATIFLMLQSNLTIEFWQKIAPLKVIDLPWRFLGITALASSFLTAATVKFIKPALWFLLLIALVLVANRNHLRINQTLVRDDNYFASYNGTATQYNEFTPIWRQSTRVPIGFDPQLHVQTQTGQAAFLNVKNKSNELSFVANVISQNSSIRINRLYFPKTSITLDGKKLSSSDITITNSTNLRLDQEQDTSGLAAINMTQGSHQVLAEFGETKLRMFADYLSLVTFILALATVVKYAKA